METEKKQTQATIEDFLVESGEQAQRIVRLQIRGYCPRHNKLTTFDYDEDISREGHAIYQCGHPHCGQFLHQREIMDYNLNKDRESWENQPQTD